MNLIDKMLLVLGIFLLWIIAGCSREEPERESGSGNDRPAIRTTAGNNPRPHRAPDVDE